MAGSQNWSKKFLQNALFCTVMVTFATGMALSRRSRKEEAQAVVGGVPNVEPWRPYYISHACEWTFLDLNCPRGRVINVVRANYGRQNLDYCPHMKPRAGFDLDEPCVGPARKTARIVSSMCNGKMKCKIPVFNGLFGDPCPSTHKYLEVYYACVDPSSPT